MTRDTSRSREFAREQSLTDLEQAIGNRAQLHADREQARLDHEQGAHDDRCDRSVGCVTGWARALYDRQGQIDREQFSRDFSQRGLDRAQAERDDDQHTLDDRRAMLRLTVAQQFSPELAAVRFGASERAQAVNDRTQATLDRAAAFVIRAEANTTRLQAYGDSPYA